MQGYGVSDDVISVPLELRGQNLSLDFYYTVASGTYTTGDLIVRLYDTTNNSLITSTIEAVPTTITGVSNRFTTQFTCPTNCSNVRVIIHQSTVTTNNYTLSFDDFTLWSFSLSANSSGAIAPTAIYQFDTQNGYGSSSTKIRKWVNNQILSDPTGLLTVINSSTLGNTYTVNRPCRISIAFSDGRNQGASTGITKNSNALTSSINVITDTTVLANSVIVGDTQSTTVTVSDIGMPGDVYRPHTDGIGGDSSAPNRTRIYVVAEEILSLGVNVTNVSEWTSYTPTFTSLGTVTSIDFKWRRVGSSIQINGKALIGTPSPSTAPLISMPSGYTISSSQLNSSNLYQLGRMINAGSSVDLFTTGEDLGVVTNNGTDASNLLLSWRQNGNAFSADAASNFLGAGQLITVDIEVVGAGLASAFISSNSIDQNEVRLLTASGRGAINTEIVIFTTTNINIGSDITYATSSNNGNSFTINNAGVYSLYFQIKSSAADIPYVSLNSTTFSSFTSSSILVALELLSNVTTAMSMSGYFAVNDVIRFGVTGSGTLSNSQARVVRCS